MSDEQLEQFVRRRLVEEGETPERAEELAGALVDSETRDQAPDELGARRERLADVVERLEDARATSPTGPGGRARGRASCRGRRRGREPGTPAILGGSADR